MGGMGDLPHCIQIFKNAKGFKGIGGNLNNASHAGLWYWNLNNDVGNTNWNQGARTLIK